MFESAVHAMQWCPSRSYCRMCLHHWIMQECIQQKTQQFHSLPNRTENVFPQSPMAIVGSNFMHRHQILETRQIPFTWWTSKHTVLYQLGKILGSNKNEQQICAVAKTHLKYILLNEMNPSEKAKICAISITWCSGKWQLQGQKTDPWLPWTRVGGRADHSVAVMEL